MYPFLSSQNLACLCVLLFKVSLNSLSISIAYFLTSSITILSFLGGEKKERNETSNLNFSPLLCIVVFIISQITIPHILFVSSTSLHKPLVLCNLSSAKLLFLQQIVIGHPLLVTDLDTVVILAYQIQSRPSWSLYSSSLQGLLWFHSHNDLILLVIHFTLLINPHLLEVFICVFTAVDCDVFSLIIYLSLMLFLPPTKT